MYVATFYSFKGGVGRTMALVNVATHLADRGRRVLLVDFDLEAPGLDTFPLLQARDTTPGIVDYVYQYLRDDAAPNVADFVAQPHKIDNLWVMPSGARSADYAANFRRIDWDHLYAERDGYLLFEDLKEQWCQTIKPDYVLIDSRTGYTDTGGICTRQLADAVTMLFFPNEQNLRGLSKVVADIRAEAEPPRSKSIKLHFVMSNVPDLDDEDDVLSEMKARFQGDLAFEDEPLVVHRYESLSLLNQAVFAKERPKSRLAKEYGELATRIIGGNLADREGALRRIREAWDDPDLELAEAKEIERLHAEDGEILFRLGRWAAQRGRLSEAESWLDRSIELGYRTADAHLARAEVRADSGDGEGASDDAQAALERGGLPLPRVIRALVHARGVEGEQLAAMPAVTGMDVSDQIILADYIVDLARREAIDQSTAILRSIANDARLPDELCAQARSSLALIFIGLGDYRSAIETLTFGGQRIQDLNIRDAFNYGMAVWAVLGVVQADHFERVVALDAEEGSREDANYLQCLAVANWAVGDLECAREFALRAREKGRIARRVFSCWRYRRERGSEFEADMDEILTMIDTGEPRLPRFAKEAHSDKASAD